MAGSALDDKIQGAIEMWNESFPGMLVPRTTQSDYVTFVHKQWTCQAELGRKGRQQFVWISDECTRGAIAHEVGHSLGMVHEHQRPDRDMWVKILWENIIPGNEYIFQIAAPGTTRMLGAYDYDSIMHYARTQSGVKNRVTILTPLGITIGQRARLSEGDKAGIRKRYCNPDNWSMPGGVYLGPDGGTFSFKVTAPPYCTWTVSETASFLTVAGSTTRTGTSTVTFSVPFTIKPRITDIRITSTGSDTVWIEQEGENLRF
jgi:hypothetical protein